MVTNQKLSNALWEIKDIADLDCALFDKRGRFLVSTKELESPLESVAEEFALSLASEQQYNDTRFFKIFVEGELEYVLALCSSRDDISLLGKMACCQIRNLVLGSLELMDRNHFMQNVLLGNMLTVDLYSKAKKLHIEEAKRVIFVIDTGKKNNEDAMELVRNLSNIRTKDFVTSVDEHSVVLVKDVSEIAEDDLEESLEEFAHLLVDNIQMEAMIRVRVGYSNVLTSLVKIPDSYQEAKMALEVARVFYAERDTISYGKLGIGRLIYQLPMTLCEMFIKEVFGNELPEVLEDEEAMSTISKFFENNLNISETARQLYVHRNTLVYRLERIEKSVGLDIRKFDDAMTFRIAVMVLAHMKGQKK